MLLTPPTAQLQITLTSNDPTRLLLANGPTDPGQQTINLTVAAGGDSATYYTYGLASSGTETYSVTATNYTPTSGTVNFAPSGIFIFGPNGVLSDPVSLSSGNTVPLTVETVQLSTDGTYTYEGAQPLAGNVAALTVNLSNVGNPTIAGTVPASVTIATGASAATAVFTPTAVGQSTVSVTQPAGWFAPMYPGYSLTSTVINVNP
jgi:hypothetical protein